MTTIRLAPILLAATVAGSAHADEIPTREVVGPAAHPVLVHSERACNEGKEEAGFARTKSLTLSGVRVEILHECGGTPASSELAVRTDAGWFIEDGFTIEDLGANMSDPRFHYSLVDETLGGGTLADGSPAIVYRSISHHDMVASSGRIVESELVAEVMICSVHDGVRCGRIAYTCPAAGCAATTLVGGVLTAIERHDYTYESRN